jgi:two-component system, chemotaxis family, chemotaxis protein CheY
VFVPSADISLLPDPRKVLIVDDSPTVRMSISTVLKGAGQEILQASDGVEGAASIASTPDLALVICDVSRPRMGGVEMLSLIKGQQRYADLPVIMLTTETRPSLIARARVAGIRGGSSSRSSQTCC